MFTDSPAIVVVGSLNADLIVNEHEAAQLFPARGRDGVRDWNAALDTLDIVSIRRAVITRGEVGAFATQTVGAQTAYPTLCDLESWKTL